MAREILFKAKRIDNGEWVEGSYLFCPVRDKEKSELENITYKHWIVTKEGFCYEIDINTLCQFTGLNDKNGNKIWENDVVDASKGWWNASGPAGHSSLIIKVEWNEGFCGFVPFADYDCDCGVYIDSGDVEVIGNAFDNPELIGGAE